MIFNEKREKIMAQTARTPKTIDKQTSLKRPLEHVNANKTAPVYRSANKSAVISKAVINAAGLLGLSQARLAEVLGVSTSTVSRLHTGSYFLSPEKKEWEFAVLLVRLFRSLDAIVGGIAEDARRWLNSYNHALADKKPVELILSTEGLVRVVYYLDARRGII
jgi:transcriptional regulator with XRE-family HTH domain